MGHPNLLVAFEILGPSIIELLWYCLGLNMHSDIQSLVCVLNWLIIINITIRNCGSTESLKCLYTCIFSFEIALAPEKMAMSPVCLGIRAMLSKPKKT